MKTISVKTSELTGAALRYAVAVAAGFEVQGFDGECLVTNWIAAGIGEELGVIGSTEINKTFAPDKKWSQLGPLIERFEIEVSPNIANPIYE